jgi:molybdenum cofactor cytidylyltransferase
MIAAIVLAAGQSTRMGSPKMVLPWGKQTVIGQVISVLMTGGVDEILVVTGGAREEVENALKDNPVRLVHNPHFTSGEMLSTFQTGISALGEKVTAALITLGDQPGIEPTVVRSVIQTYQTNHAVIVVPSYQMRRGHPWILDRALWSAALELRKPATLRDFLNQNADLITYLPVETGSILSDLDTPEDYARLRPNG